MSAQTNYGYATARGVAGGIYDGMHYPIDTRVNEENNGVLRCGVGVVKGVNAGYGIALPTATNTAEDFEGVVVNGFTQQHDLEGEVFVGANQAAGIIHNGRVWVRVATGEEPSYGEALHLVLTGDDAGCFATTGGVAVNGKFIGAVDNGVAPVELFGFEIAPQEAPANTNVL